MSVPAQHLPSAPDAEAGEAARLAALHGYAIVDTPAEQAYDDIVQLACALCEVPVAAVSLIDRDRQWFKARRGLAYGEAPRSQSLCDWAIRQPEQLLEVADIHADARFRQLSLYRGDTPLRFYAGMPVLGADGHALGTVCVLDTRPRQLDDRQRDALAALARQTGHLLELRRHAQEQRRLACEREAYARQLEDTRQDLQRRHDDLKREATHDALTGLLNRAALAQLQGSAEAMQQLHGAPYVLALLDIDHFKQVNDRHGHLLGDRALRAVADAVSATLRAGDIAVRYGGEEFLVVLPNTRLDAGAEVAERIRRQVLEMALPFALTVSIGIADGEPEQDTPETVFDRADQALYRAKAGGRNRIAVDDTPR